MRWRPPSSHNVTSSPPGPPSPSRRCRGRGLAPELLRQLAHGLFTSSGRVGRSRAAVPLLDALVTGPRRPRLDRALVRVLEAVAPLRPPDAVAAVVRRFGRADVDLARLGRGVTALLLESFDELAGLALGVDSWVPLEAADLTRLVGRLRDEPLQLSRLSTRCAEHGRARMLVALATDPARLDDALQRSVELFGFLAPVASTDPPEHIAYLRVVTRLMRLTALQQIRADRPEAVPPGVLGAWPVDAGGARLPLGRLGRAELDHLGAVLDEHSLLTVAP